MRAQLALAELKASIRATLSHGPAEGMTNAQLGRSLGIYAGHAGHVGHISRSLLEMLKSEGVVAQDPLTKRWRLVSTQDDVAETDWSRIGEIRVAAGSGNQLSETSLSRFDRAWAGWRPRRQSNLRPPPKCAFAIQITPYPSSPM